MAELKVEEKYSQLYVKKCFFCFMRFLFDLGENSLLTSDSIHKKMLSSDCSAKRYQGCIQKRVGGVGDGGGGVGVQVVCMQASTRFYNVVYDNIILTFTSLG